MKRIVDGELVVLPRNLFVMDVFTSEDGMVTGWDNHRLFQMEKGKPRLVRGIPLSSEQYSKLCELVRK